MAKFLLLSSTTCCVLYGDAEQKGFYHRHGQLASQGIKSGWLLNENSTSVKWIGVYDYEYINELMSIKSLSKTGNKKSLHSPYPTAVYCFVISSLSKLPNTTPQIGTWNRSTTPHIKGW